MTKETKNKLAELKARLANDECPFCGRDNEGFEKCTSDDCPGVQELKAISAGGER